MTFRNRKHQMLRPFIMNTDMPLLSRRRGLLNIELLVAAAVLGMAISLLLPGMQAASRVRQARQFEVLARVELNNLRSAAEAAATPQLSTWFLTRYPDAELSISAVPGSELWPAGAGVRLSISRPETDRGRAAPVSLVFWPVSGGRSGATP
jgi:type II secretory pathway pseudopilin PulG